MSSLKVDVFLPPQMTVPPMVGSVAVRGDAGAAVDDPLEAVSEWAGDDARFWGFVGCDL